jgi:hypothetical protein
MELSAEPSCDSFNLEAEVMAMLDEEVPDLGEVDISQDFKLDDAETGDVDKVPESREVNVTAQESREANATAPESREASQTAPPSVPPPPPPFVEPVPPPPPPFVEEGEEDFSEEYLFGPDEPGQAGTEREAAAKPSQQEAQEPATDTAATDSASFERELRREMEEGAFDPKTSRYMRDEKGDLLYKWKADYAPRGGGGRAQCKDQDCLERHEQGGIRAIEKGCLRIGRRVLVDSHGGEGEGHIQIMWHHARCMFNTFLRAKKSTRVIETEFDIENFEDLTLEDRDSIRRLIDGNEAAALRNVRFRSFENQIPTRTPDKRNISSGGAGGPGDTSSSKRRKKDEEQVVKKGDRVWAHFRCLPKEGAAVPPGGVALSVKSEKPELAMVREDIDGGTVAVQFESTEHEKVRLELYVSKRGRKIKGWLRYPRLFEGKKQRVPADWIKWKRPVPILCACVKQEWGHGVACGDITCGRRASISVFGVAG